MPSRQITIINALCEVVPHCAYRPNDGAAWLFDRTVRGTIELVPGETDTGVVQIDSLHPDEGETIVAGARISTTLRRPRRAGGGAAPLARRPLVVSDAPPLAVPPPPTPVSRVVCANFTWDWIYREATREQPGVAELVAAIGDSYARASGGMANAGPRRLRDDSGHRGHPSRGPARPCPGRPAFGTKRSGCRRSARSRWSPSAATAFASFRSTLDCLRDWDVVVSSRREEPAAAARRSLRSRGRTCTTAAAATRIWSERSTSSSPSLDTASSRTAWPTARRCSTRRADGCRIRGHGARDAGLSALPVPRIRGVRDGRWPKGSAELSAVPPPRAAARRWRRSRGGDDCRPGQCALTVVTSDQIRGKFTFSMETGLRSAWARNAGRSRSDLNPM